MIFNIFRKGIRVRVSGVLIQDNKLLLVAHKKSEKIYWLLPGGGVSFGESLEEALKRELMEELSIEIDVNQFAFICDSIDPYGRRHLLNICFKCSRESGNYVLGSDKRLHDFGFFDNNELSNMTLFPPIKSDLISIMNSRETKSYLGSVWLE